ncbi:MAG: DegV family protein [Pygmaiobacter massiliensis]|nr:DegV family protein [Pygmaiobacter massiliensis]
MSTQQANFAKNPERIAVLTDSCADLDSKVRKNKPVFLLPLQIRSFEKEYADGVDIFAQDVYEYQQRGEELHTSLPAGETVDRVLDSIVAQGYRRVIAIHLSAGLSGTYNLVRLRAAERDDLMIRVFDSNSGSLGIGAVVLQAWQEICEGASWNYMVERRIPWLIQNTFPLFSVDRLDLLEKGGRIGKVSAIAGRMLNIKPIIGFAEDGQLVSVAKVRGRNAVQPKFIELLGKKMAGHRNYNLAVANGGAPDEMAELTKKMKEAFPDYKNIWRTQIDATLSCYIGSGVLGAAIQFLD